MQGWGFMPEKNPSLTHRRTASTYEAKFPGTRAAATWRGMG